jgi:DNA-binding Xre family transcriptional regulator
MIQERVKARMESKGVSILGLVETTGLSSRTIRRARSPLIARCTLETLDTIAQALGCRVKDLFAEAGEDTLPHHPATTPEPAKVKRPKGA